MKCFETVVLHRLLRQAEGKRDALQFAYKRNVGVGDTILSLLHDTYTHLDKVGYFVRILFRLLISVLHYTASFASIKVH